MTEQGKKSFSLVAKKAVGSVKGERKDVKETIVKNTQEEETSFAPPESRTTAKTTGKTFFPFISSFQPSRSRVLEQGDSALAARASDLSIIVRNRIRSSVV